MKKKIVSLVLAIIMLMSTIVFPSKVEATIAFSDVADDHWAAKYITAMQDSGIINGYEDGTFKPENLVKNGEFIKMLVMCRWPITPNEELEEGVHWSTPYNNLADGFIIDKKLYDYDRLEEEITRADAVRMLWRMYKVMNKNLLVDQTEKYIKQYSDEATITDEDTRYYFNACMQYGLINGYDDGTIKAYETLTRAQATKLLSILLYK